MKSYVTGSVDKTCKLWDVRDEKAKQTFFGHEADVNSVCFHNSGQAFATASEDKTARLFDIRSDQQLGHYKPPGNSGFTSCGLSLSGRYLLAGADDNFVHSWDTLKVSHTGTLSGHENRVTSISLSPNGVALATCSWDQSVKSAGDIIIKAHTQTIVVPQGPPIKYILLWTTETAIPFLYLGKGQTVFKNKGCQWTNCYVTSDRNYLGFYTEFDVIAFNGPQLNTILHMKDLPARRSIHQKYVYANIESAANYPVANNVLDHYFNWTWTYKLNSDAIWGYFAVKNPYNEVIGPKTNMHWIDIDQMEPIDDNIKNRLKLKKRAAAMFSSNCLTLSRRERYVKKIQEELLKYKLELDIYGACGTHQCPRNIMDRCLNLLEKYYYFYFAFENAMSEDYVTEKIVYALNHFSVPVVFGGANYTRFMPDGIYLNALELGPERLAQRMNYIILNPSLYHSFFKWKKYYSFHFRNEDPSTDDYCNFCAMLNNERVNTTTVYLNLSSWWNDHRMYDSNNIDNKFISKDQNTELLDLP